MEVQVEGSRDPRMEYLMDYTLRTLRLKPDKWSRMLVSDEQRTFVNAFIDRPGPQVNSFFVVQCLKTTRKVAFNNTSEASYVYILSGQKFIKNAKNGQFRRVLENLKLAAKQCYQTEHF